MADSQVKVTTGPHIPSAYDSSPSLRNRAKASLSQLHFHSIGLSQLLEEGIDEDVLRTLYVELGFPLPCRTALESADDLTSNDLSLHNQNAIEERAPDLENTIMLESTPLDLQNLSIKSNAEVSTTSAPPSNATKPAVDSDEVDSSVKGYTPLKDVVNTLKSKPGIASVLPRSSGSKASIKSVTSKPQGDTMERKDYIARMLAAKAGKTLAVKASFRSPAMTTLPDPNVADKQQTNSEASPSSNTTNDVAPISSAATDADLEAKKRAQTELARQKMDALINRGNGQQVEPRKPNKQELAVVAQSPPQESSPQVTSGSQANLVVTAELQAFSLPQGRSPAPSTPRIAVDALSETLDFGAMPTTPLSGIPGLFMTSSTPLPLSRSDVSLPTNQQMNAEAFPEQPLSTTYLTHSQPTSAANLARSDSISPRFTNVETKFTSPVIANDAEKSRKRAKASDFIDGPAVKFKKTFGLGQPSRLIIEVSEDEANETSDADADEYLMDLEEDAKASQYKNVPEASVPTAKQRSIRDLPPLSDFPSAKKSMPGSGIDTPPGVQTPGKGKEQEDLRRKEEQIELMNRKIAEMEQRRKAKQTASRAHTPGTPARSGSTPNPETSLAEVSKQSQAVTDVVQMIDENTGELEARKTQLAAAEASMQEKLYIKEEARLAEVAKAENERVAAANAATSAELDQRRRRRAEIESGLPKLNAEVERTKTKLDVMKKQMEELEAELQLGVQGRETLMQELERLAMVAEESLPAEPPVFLIDDNQLRLNSGILVERGQ